MTAAVTNFIYRHKVQFAMQTFGLVACFFGPTRYWALASSVFFSLNFAFFNSNSTYIKTKNENKKRNE